MKNENQPNTENRMPDKETKMQAHTVSYVSFTEVLSRLNLPSQEDVHEVAEAMADACDVFGVTNSFSLVPWSVLADDLSDCMIEMGYEAPDINTIYPKTVLMVDQPQRELRMTEYIYVDLES